MTIGILTVAIGEAYFNAVCRALERKAEYCHKHGYHLGLFTAPTHDRPPSWEKIPAAIKFLPEFDWLFLSDADSLILNQDIRLESFIEKATGDLVIARDANALNAGNFFLRSTPWSMAFLRELWDHTLCVHHPWWENEALMRVIKEKPSYLAEKIEVVNQNLFNSYVDTYRPGDFLVHFAGCREPAKLEQLIAQWLQTPPKQ